MEKEKCDYCGQEYDKSIMRVLNNGSPACPTCVKKEEEKEKEKTSDE